MGAVNCKLDLHQVLGIDEKGEKRKIVQTLVIPTASLVELCNVILSNFSQNTEILRAALKEQEQKIIGNRSAGEAKATNT